MSLTQSSMAALALLVVACAPVGPAEQDAGDGGTGSDGGAASAVIRGRFESTGPVRTCEGMANWDGPDGALLRFTFDLCDGDMNRLAATILANLDAVQERGQRAMLVVGQGIFTPDAWLAECETFHLDVPNFVGDLCLPWDPTYQANLRAALETIGAAVNGHPALAGMYFTISTMTNGSELHFRVDRTAFPDPGEGVLRSAYLDVMDIFQETIDVPIVFEAGHCVFFDRTGTNIDCETPLALYQHARDTYGATNTGIALWNCAERFWADTSPEALGTRAVIEAADGDGASIGCQTVGAFTNGACRFTDADVADYGTPPTTPGGDCPVSDTFDPAAACVDTMRWFAGVSSRAPSGVVLHGTWSEVWSQDYDASGVYHTDSACHDAIDLLAAP